MTPELAGADAGAAGPGAVLAQPAASRTSPAATKTRAVFTLEGLWIMRKAGL